MELLRLSNSEMQNFRGCKRRWYLQWYRKLGKREIEFGTPSSLGTLVHTGLEAYYTAGEPGDPLAAVAEQAEADTEKWPVRAEEIAADLEMATIMLEGYLQWLEESGEDADIEVLSSGEASRSVSLGDPIRSPAGREVPVLLMAKLDAHVRKISENGIYALEHKTVQSLEQPLDILKLNTQALTQHLVEFLTLLQNGQESGERADGTLWNMLRKVKRTARAKPPFYGRLPVRHNVAELRSHWYHVVSVASDIIATVEQLEMEGANHHVIVPPNPTRDCSWSCPFFRVCVMADDGSDFEGALKDLYVTIDPLERYAVSAEKE